MLILAALASVVTIPATGFAQPAPQAPPPALQPGKYIGFSYDAVPDGAEIRTVVEESPAARAGLKPGMVVTQLNGNPLTGLEGKRIRDMFASAPDEMTLVVRPLGAVKLRREAISESSRAAYNARIGAQ